MVKISSKRKSLKIQQIPRNLVSLMPSAHPSLGQVLLSLILHRKTGSRDVVDTINRLGYGVSYTQTLFIADKWAEWDRGQTVQYLLISPKNVLTTLVADNIDWENKSLSGIETHNTNCILIQHRVLSQNIGCPKVSLQGNYEFDRKKHSSFRILLTELPRFFFKSIHPSEFSSPSYQGFSLKTFILQNSPHRVTKVFL